MITTLTKTESAETPEYQEQGPSQLISQPSERNQVDSTIATLTEQANRFTDLVRAVLDIAETDLDSIAELSAVVNGVRDAFDELDIAIGFCKPKAEAARSMRKSRLPPDVVAYHEAGHAVAAILAGFKVKSAVIRANGTGEVETDEDWNDLTPDAAEKSLGISLAGTIAQWMYQFGPDHMPTPRWKESVKDVPDCEHALKAVAAICGVRKGWRIWHDGYDAIMQDAAVSIRKAFLRPGVARAIKDIAEGLVEIGRLSGEEIDNICFWHLR